MGTALTTTIGASASALTASDFDEVVRRHQRRIYRFLFMLLRDAEEADNLTQECFMRAYQSCSSFRGESSVETWLLRIAANLARDHARNRKRSFWKRLLGIEAEEDWGNEGKFASPEPSPEQQVVAREAVQAVWRAADQLSQQQRAVFLLRFVEEMELQEIADVLGLRVGSVKSHLFRALQSVRSQLKEIS